MRYALLILAIASTGARADNVACLAETIFSEAGAESEIGKIAVGQTVMNRMHKLHKSVCWITRHGYTRRPIPGKVLHQYRAIANSVLHGLTAPIGDRDSFDSHKRKRHAKGAVRIGNHYFYEALR